jgi:hypothetical protein
MKSPPTLKICLISWPRLASRKIGRCHGILARYCPKMIKNIDNRCADKWNTDELKGDIGAI